MAFLFKPQIVKYVDANGKRVPPDTPGAKKVVKTARKWYGQGPPLPPKKKVPLAADKRAAAQMLAELEQKFERGETAIGGAEVDASKRSLLDHLADFAEHHRAKGVSEDHHKEVIARVRRIIIGCEMKRLADLDAGKVQSFLAGLQADDKLPTLDPQKSDFTPREVAAMLGITVNGLNNLVTRHRLEAYGAGPARTLPRQTVLHLLAKRSRGVGPQTINHNIASLKSFVHWLLEQRRLARDPLIALKTVNVKKDQRRDRRTLSGAELTRLFQATQQSGTVYRGADATDRTFIYMVACGTGFRLGELASLTPESFQLNRVPPVVLLPARLDKAGRSLVQPLPPSLADLLRPWLADRPPGQPLWPGTWHERGAEMLREDLEAAGIPYTVAGPDGPLYADFHSLRHSFVALLDHAGTSLKLAMQLARHSDPKLTMARYGRAQLEDLGTAVGKIPELAPVRLALPAPGGKGSLADAPRDLLESLAVYGLAALLAGWFTPPTK